MISEFQKMIKNDLTEVFLNPDEFGELHMVDGQEMTIIIDENELAEREAKIKTMAEGLHNKRLLIYVSAEEFGPEPRIGGLMELDDEFYSVTDVANEGGMYSISLEANRS